MDKVNLKMSRLEMMECTITTVMPNVLNAIYYNH